MESNELHLHPLDWPLFPLSALDSTQLALSSHHPDWPDDEELAGLQVYRLWYRRRERSHLAPTVAQQDDQHHLIPLNFSLESLDDLTSAQLLAVQFHPESTSVLKRQAGKVWRRRRERDLAQGRRWQLAAAPNAEEDVKPPVRATEPTPSTREPSLALPAPPPELPPLPTPTIRLPPHLAALLHTLHISNLPPSLIKHHTDIKKIFPLALQPDNAILIKPSGPAMDVYPPRAGFVAWSTFDRRTDAMQAVIPMRLERLVPRVEIVAAEAARWEWGDLSETMAQAFWAKENEVGVEEVAAVEPAPPPAAEGPPPAAPAVGIIPPSSPAPEVAAAPPPPQAPSPVPHRALSAPLQPLPPKPRLDSSLAVQPVASISTAGALDSSTVAAGSTAAQPEAALAPSTSLAPITNPASPSEPSDASPLPPSLVSRLFHITYASRRVINSNSSNVLRGIVHGCIGQLGGLATDPASGGKIYFGLFASADDREKALRTLRAKGATYGVVVDAERGTLEGWTWGDVTNKFRQKATAEAIDEARQQVARAESQQREDALRQALLQARGAKEKSASLGAGGAGEAPIETGKKRARCGEEEEEEHISVIAQKQAKFKSSSASSRAVESSLASTSAATLETTTSAPTSTSLALPATTSASTSAAASLPPLPSAATVTPVASADFDPFTDETSRPLPPGWRREQSRSMGGFFYAQDGGVTTWDNPIDAEMERERVRRAAEAPTEMLVLDDDSDEMSLDEEVAKEEIDGLPVVEEAAPSVEERAPPSVGPSVDPAPQPSASPPAPDPTLVAEEPEAQPLAFLIPRAQPPTGPRSSAPSAKPLDGGGRPAAPAPTLVARTAPPIALRGSAPSSAPPSAGSLVERLARPAGATSSGGSGKAAEARASLSGSTSYRGAAQSGGSSLFDRLDSAREDSPSSNGKGKGKPAYTSQTADSHKSKHSSSSFSRPTSSQPAQPPRAARRTEDAPRPPNSSASTSASCTSGRAYAPSSPPSGPRASRGNLSPPRGHAPYPSPSYRGGDRGHSHDGRGGGISLGNHSLPGPARAASSRGGERGGGGGASRDRVPSNGGSLLRRLG